MLLFISKSNRRFNTEENINIFRAFMDERYAAQLTQEISLFQQEIKQPKDQGRGLNFMFLPRGFVYHFLESNCRQCCHKTRLRFQTSNRFLNC
jgi:hypothetical protein